MMTHRRLRLALIAATLALPVVAGCDVDNHKTATGTRVEAPETRGTEDPGKVKSGGPGTTSPEAK